MKKYSVIFLFVFVCIFAQAQQNKTLLIGINPSVTIKKSYPKGCFDINILPLVLEYNITKNLDIRGISLLNYGIRNIGSALVDIGAEVTIPYYIRFSNSSPQTPSGLFVAIGSAFTRNVFYKHKSISVFLEPGYNFLWNNNFSLIVDLQYGRTFFMYDDGHNITGNHFNVRLILGWWIK
ncbi:MAG TPA: hypothetical protein PLL66_05775 [Bacteroidales bacterium]|nr:hypothetical protein [Bacteroidales bacterium]